MLPKFVMKNTVVHNLSLRVKFLVVLFIFVFSLCVQDMKIYLYGKDTVIYAWYLLLFVIIVIYALSILARIHKEFAILSKYSFFTVLMVFLFNMLLYTTKPGDTCIYSLQIVSLFGYNISIVITDGAIHNSITQSLRLLAVISIFFIFMLTQDPDAFFSSGKHFRKHFRNLRLLFMLTFRFYSLLSRDAIEITNAQRSRGLELDGNFFDRIRKRAYILLPLLQTSLERSISVAEAMESRKVKKGS